MLKKLTRGVLLSCSISLFTGIASAQTPTIQKVYQNPWVQIAQASGTGRMAYARAFTFDFGSPLTKKILYSWSTDPDVVSITAHHTYVGTINNGSTWTAPGPTNTTGIGDFDLQAPARRNTDGVLFSQSFFWGAGFTPPLSSVYWTSTDNGNTWARQNNGTITGFPAGREIAGIRFQRGPIQDADGTLYAPAQGQVRNTDGTWQATRVMLLKSTNGGVTWNFVSDIQYTSNVEYGETTIVRCKDGSILAVLRSGPAGTPQPLKFRRSTDNGLTWGGAVTYVPNLPSTDQGVDPVLELLPNGILVLSYGNNLYSSIPLGRNCVVAFSPDGNGNSWVSRTETFVCGSTPSLSAKNRSTGYTSVVPIKTNRFMQFSDRGDYRYYGSVDNPSPNPFSVWYKPMEIETNYKNRIDLKTKFASSQVAITTDMNYTDATHPMAKPEGAFDANIYYWNGAFKAATSGSYQVDLLQNHKLNAIAICLLKGRPQNATIEYMPDGGTTWSTLKTYTNATHYTVDYTSFAEVTARYVRVNVQAPSGTMVGINELVLFNSADTYEDAAYGTYPYGYTPLSTSSPGFWVTEGVVPLPSGYQSLRALYMEDLDAAAGKNITKGGYTASATKTWEFKLRTKGYASGGSIQFALKSGSTNVFQLAVFSSGAIAYYNGSWHALPGTPVPLDTWKSIKVVANAASTASVYVDGVLIGSAPKATASATSINGFSFGSSGSSATGDKALFDDVILYDTPAQTLSKQASTSSISDLTTKNSDLSTAFSVKVSPNPASDVVKLDVIHPGQEPLKIRFLNTSGVAVKKLQHQVSGNASQIEVPVQDLVPGMYIIQITQGGQVISSKVIVK